MASVLDDELLANLVAAGSADVLVGLFTRDNADTAGALVHAVVTALGGPFLRKRAVILNIDLGSSDGTPDIVSETGAAPASLRSDKYALRSVPRIATALPALAGRDKALRILFTVADLLRVGTVVVLDPANPSLNAAEVARWIGAILNEGAEYAKPALARGPFDGPLVTQLVRPLLSAAYSVELLEPVDTQLACSGGFATASLAADFWDSPFSKLGIDAFLSARAMSVQCRLGQVATPFHGRPSLEARLSVSEVFVQVVGATLTSLARDKSSWLDNKSVTRLPVVGDLPEPGASGSSFDVPELEDAFRLGVDALAPLLTATLGGELFSELSRAAAAKPQGLDDPLWAQVVFRFVAAAKLGQTPIARLAQMLEPLYLGRLASYVERQTSPARITEPLETLASLFQTQKAAFAAETPPRREH